MRYGITAKLRVGEVKVFITLNRDEDDKPIELFAKATHGWQGWGDCLMEMASVAMQHGTPLAIITQHMRFRRMEPMGIAGQGNSIPDAIAIWLETQLTEKEKEQK